VNIDGIAATKGDVLVRSATAWGAVPGTTIAHTRSFPTSGTASSASRTARATTLRFIRSGSPLFDSEGFSDPNLNGIECGGFWIDKYQACMHDATNVSRGSSTVNDPGTHGAASKPGVVIWTDINWTNAKIAIENRGGSGNKKTGTCAAFGAGSTTQFYVAAITDLIGAGSGSRRAVSPTSAVSSRPAATRPRTQTPRNSSRSTRHSGKHHGQRHLRDRAALYPWPVRVVQPGGMGDEATSTSTASATRKATRTGVRTPPTRGTRSTRAAGPGAPWI